MDKLEEAARKHAGITPDVMDVKNLRDLRTIKSRKSLQRYDSFVKGAEWQNNNMWISVEEALPQDEITKVICMMKSNGELASGYIYLNNGVPTIETNPAFEFEDYANYEVTHWMPIPEI